MSCQHINLMSVCLDEILALLSHWDSGKSGFNEEDGSLTAVC